MAPRWDEVTASPQYTSLPDEEKKTVKERYWNNVVAASEQYQGLDATEQGRVRTRFFGPEVRVKQPEAAKDATTPTPTTGTVASPGPGDTSSKLIHPWGKTTPKPTPVYISALKAFQDNDIPRAKAILAKADAGDINSHNLTVRIKKGATPPPTVLPNTPYPKTTFFPSREDVSTGLKTYLDVNKELLFTRPAAGAKVLRDAAIDLVAPTEASIEQSAAATGRVPYLKIAGRTAADLAAESIPLTPTEIVSYAAFGKVAEGAGIAGKALAKKIPAKAMRVLQQINRFGRSAPITQAAENAGMTALLGVEEKAAAKVPVNPAAGAADDATNLLLGVTPDTMPTPARGVVNMNQPLPPPTESGQRAAERLVLRSQGMGAGQVSPPIPDKEFFGQQLAKFNVADDALAVFEETSKSFRPTIEAARRGKVDWAGTRQLAENLGMSPEDMVKRRRGQAFNAEEIEAAKALTGSSMERVSAAQKAYAQHPDQAALANLAAEMTRHSRVQASFMGARAEAGRALQIMRKVTDPVNIAKQNYQAMLDAIGGDQMTRKAADLLAKIDPSDVAAVNTFIRNFTKAKTSDKVYEVWINSILSSPLTHKANVVGNTLFTLSRAPEKFLRGTIDSGIGMFTGKRTAYASEVAPEVYGFFRGLPDGVRRALYAFRTGTTEAAASKLEMGRIPTLKGKVGEFIRIPTRALVAEDEFAKAVNGRMELSALALRKAKQAGLKGGELAKRVAELEANPTDEMMEVIEKETLYRSFQDPGGEGMRHLMQMRNSVPGLRYILPFLQTPMNVAKRAIERSPLGWIKTINSVAKGKGQAVIAQDAANALMGSGIAAAVATYAAQGRITGEPPKDAAERDRFYRSGKLPYAIKLGDKWYSYARLEPFSMVIGGVAQTVQLAQAAGKDPDANLAGAIVSSIPKYLANQTFLTGVRDVLNALDDPERFGSRWVKRNAGSMMPYSGFTRFIAQQLDDTIRQPDTIVETIKANIPGLSQGVPARYDVYGQPSKRPNDIFSTLVVPRSQERVSPLDVEDVELDRGQGFPGKSMGGIPLAPKEYRELAKTSGQVVLKARKMVLKISGWSKLPPETRVQTLDKITSEARDEGKRKIFRVVLDRLSGEDRQRFIEYGIRRLRIAPTLEKRRQ